MLAGHMAPVEMCRPSSAKAKTSVETKKSLGHSDNHPPLVILGLDPRIHGNNRTLLQPWTLGSSPRVSGLDFSLVFEVPVAVGFSGVAGLAGRQKQTRLSLSGLTRESTVATEERRQRGRITALKHRFWHLPWTPGSSPGVTPGSGCAVRTY